MLIPTTPPHTHPFLQLPQYYSCYLHQIAGRPSSWTSHITHRVSDLDLHTYQKASLHSHAAVLAGCACACWWLGATPLSTTGPFICDIPPAKPSHCHGMQQQMHTACTHSKHRVCTAVQLLVEQHKAVSCSLGSQLLFAKPCAQLSQLFLVPHQDLLLAVWALNC